MTPGWQALVDGAALVLFVVAAVAVAVTARAAAYWPVFVALGLALVTLVPLWAAASAA